jgi:hypothetical protein
LQLKQLPLRQKEFFRTFLKRQIARFAYVSFPSKSSRLQSVNLISFYAALFYVMLQIKHVNEKHFADFSFNTIYIIAL